MILTHYTSYTGLRLITKSGFLLPFPQKILDGRPAIWMTDTAPEQPGTLKARRALGLDHEMYGEDRSAAWATVVQNFQDDPILLWSNVAYGYPGSYAASDAPLGARPDTWWLCFEPINLPTVRGEQ